MFCASAAVTALARPAQLGEGADATEDDAVVGPAEPPLAFCEEVEEKGFEAGGLLLALDVKNLAVEPDVTVLDGTAPVVKVVVTVEKPKLGSENMSPSVGSGSV